MVYWVWVLHVCQLYFPSEKEVLVQGRYPGCAVAELVNSIFSPSHEIASQLSLPWACLWLFMACSQRCAACLFPAFLTLWFRANSDKLMNAHAHACTLRHTLAHLDTHWDTSTVTHTHNLAQTHNHTQTHAHILTHACTSVRVCVCMRLWVWLCVSECVWWCVSECVVRL